MTHVSNHDCRVVTIERTHHLHCRRLFQLPLHCSAGCLLLAATGLRCLPGPPLRWRPRPQPPNLLIRKEWVRALPVL